MTPLHWIIGLIAIGSIVLEIIRFEKDPENYTPKKYKKSLKSPVASNAELFDAFTKQTEQENSESK